MQCDTYEWSHSMGEVVNSLISAGMRIECLNEVPYSTYKALPYLVRRADGMWEYPHGAEKLPLMFSIRAIAE